MTLRSIFGHAPRNGFSNGVRQRIVVISGVPTCKCLSGGVLGARVTLVSVVLILPSVGRKCNNSCVLVLSGEMSCAA